MPNLTRKICTQISLAVLYFYRTYNRSASFSFYPLKIQGFWVEQLRSLGGARLNRPISILLRRYQVCTISLDRSAEMGAQLRGAQDVEVGVPGSSGVDQGERPNNVGYSRPCDSAMGNSGVLGCPCSPHPQSLALAACGGKIVCSGCSAWLTDTCPAPPVSQSPH